MCIKSHCFLCHPYRSWEFHDSIKYQCPGVTVPKCRRFHDVNFPTVRIFPIVTAILTADSRGRTTSKVTLTHAEWGWMHRCTQTNFKENWSWNVHHHTTQRPRPPRASCALRSDPSQTGPVHGGYLVYGRKFSRASLARKYFTRSTVDPFYRTKILSNAQMEKSDAGPRMCGRCGSATEPIMTGEISTGK